MTEHPNEIIYCAPHFYSQLNHQLNNSSPLNDVAQCLYRGNDFSNQLIITNSNYNVQAVVDKVKRDIEHTYRNLDVKENNNGTVDCHKQNSTNINTNNTNTNNNNNNIQTNIIDNSNGHLADTKMASPTETADLNSNPPAIRLSQFACSIASSHDFTHDNDYQWFADYG